MATSQLAAPDLSGLVLAICWICSVCLLSHSRKDFGLCLLEQRLLKKIGLLTFHVFILRFGIKLVLDAILAIYCKISTSATLVALTHVVLELMSLIRVVLRSSVSLATFEIILTHFVFLCYCENRL